MIRIETTNGNHVWVRRSSIDTVQKDRRMGAFGKTVINIGERELHTEDSVDSIMKRLAFDDWAEVMEEDCIKENEAEDARLAAERGAHC